VHARLTYLEELDPFELPTAADAMKDEDCRAGLIATQLSGSETNIGSQPVRIQLFRSHNP
jgi:hypothetical protein